jgi:hypothetical protein
MNARRTISDMNQMMHYLAGQLTVAEQRIARPEQKGKLCNLCRRAKRRPMPVAN